MVMSAKVRKIARGKSLSIRNKQFGFDLVKFEVTSTYSNEVVK